MGKRSLVGLASVIFAAWYMGGIDTSPRPRDSADPTLTRTSPPLQTQELEGYSFTPSHLGSSEIGIDRNLQAPSYGTRQGKPSWITCSYNSAPSCSDIPRNSTRICDPLGLLSALGMPSPCSLIPRSSSERTDQDTGLESDTYRP